MAARHHTVLVGKLGKRILVIAWLSTAALGRDLPHTLDAIRMIACPLRRCAIAPARAGGYIAKRVAGFYVPALAPRLHTAIKLDPAILSLYAGDYRLEEQFTIKVSVAGDRLETTWLGEKITLVPESETAFFEEDSDRMFRFVKDASDKITSLIISVPVELTLRKLP